MQEPSNTMVTYEQLHATEGRKVRAKFFMTDERMIEVEIEQDAFRKLMESIATEGKKIICTRRVSGYSGWGPLVYINWDNVTCVEADIR